MKIAILGWGSLIWSPKNLNYNKEFGWNTQGPLLPIEFSRISNDGRLTLVIDKKADPIKTLFSISNYTDLDVAILDLAIREGCSKDKIGYCRKAGIAFEYMPTNFLFKKEIENWLSINHDIDAVIWTNLSVKFKDVIGLEYSPINVIKYLQTLPSEKQVLAEEYIRKTPSQIHTNMRKIIEQEFKWTKI